jgi:hypothetical protein
VNIMQGSDVRLGKPVSPADSIPSVPKVAHQHQDTICTGGFNKGEIIWGQGHSARTPQAASSPGGRTFRSLGDLPT